MDKTKIVEQIKAFFSEEEKANVETSTKFKFTIITSIDKWEVEVDADVIEVGTQLHQVWSLGDGEYELEDGRKIQVDSDGIVVLITEAEGEEEVVEEPETVEDEVVEDSELEKATKVISEMAKEIEDLTNSNTKLSEEGVKLSKEIEKLTTAPAEEEVKLNKVAKSKTAKETVLERYAKIRSSKK